MAPSVELEMCYNNLVLNCMCKDIELPILSGVMQNKRDKLKTIVRSSTKLINKHFANICVPIYIALHFSNRYATYPSK